METKIILFSSDATDLYRGDVFRVLALPDAHTIQFRYERQYVLPAYRDKPDGLIGREAVIFFLAGNDLSKPPDQRTLVQFPVRSCRIVHAFLDANTQQVILILELCGFVNCRIEQIADRSALPPSIFVTSANLEDVRKVDWLDRVKAIESSFPNTLFYRISAVLSGIHTVKPTYSPDFLSSYYTLEEESEYALECSYYDPAGGRTQLKIDVSAADLDVRNLFEWGGGARLDTRRLPITTRTLKSRSAPAYMKFYSKTPRDTDPNFVEVHWRLAQRSSKPRTFGCLTTLGAAGVFLAQTTLKDSKGGLLSFADLAISFVGMVVVGIAAGLLFKLFNKI